MGKAEVTINAILLWGNVIASGLVAIVLSWFFAEGAIGEADSLTPQFFLLIPIWAIGAFLLWRIVLKEKNSPVTRFNIMLGSLIPWIMIPLGLRFAFQFV